MKRSWKDLGEVWSGRALAAGERVTLNVFDKSLKTLLEQITFRPERDEHREQMIWVADFCRHINTRSALVRAGVEDENGDWDILESGYRNHYWNICSRELVVTTTVPRNFNWSKDRCVPIHSSTTLAAGTRLRMNVRAATGVLLETVEFTPAPNRLTPGLWTKDFAIQINNTSHLVRAGISDRESITPYHEGQSNAIWLPHNGDFKVTWSIDALKEVGKLEADRDAKDGEQISLFVFDPFAERMLDRITLIAKAEKNRLKKEQWPADLAKQINASSGHARAGVRSGANFTPKDSVNENVLCQRYAELHSFHTALHLNNWILAFPLSSAVDLKPHDCVQIKVTTSGKGQLCEALTFTPDPKRLKSGQWHHDLSLFVNTRSLYLKAGYKDAASKTFMAKEDTNSNALWLPAWSDLKVSIAAVTLRNIGFISAEHDFKANEGCKVFVLDDTSEEVLREISFSCAEKRNGSSLAPKDLAARINSQTQLIAAGERTGNEAPLPMASGYRNTLWACDPNVRAFTTLMSLKNWVKGAPVGNNDFKINQQMVIRVRGGKTGRIFESMVFWPVAGRFGLQTWSQDLCNEINSRMKFIRAGEANTAQFIIEAAFSNGGNCFWTPAGSGLVVESEIISGIAPALPGMTSEAKQLFDQHAEARRLISVDAWTGKPTLNIPVAGLYADDSLSQPLKVSLSFEDELFLRFGDTGRYASMPGGKLGNVFLLPLRDGRKVKVDIGMKEDINGGDFTISSFIGGMVGDYKPVGFTVRYKDGGADDFIVEALTDKGGVLPLRRYAISSGCELKIAGISGTTTSTTKVTKNSETLLEAKKSLMAGAGLVSVVVYPESSTEKVTWTFSAKAGLKTRFEVDGLGANGKVVYCITTDSSNRIISVEAEQQHSFTVDKKTETDKAVHKETLQYAADGKVSRHDICRGGGLDDLVHEFTYANDVTRLVAYHRTTAPRTAFERTYRFAGGQSSLEDYGSEAVPICRKQSHSLDNTDKCVVSSTKVWEGNVLVDEQVMRVDAIGNPVSHGENDLTTHYTYYNNYKQFEVKETAERVQDYSFFGWLFKPFDYINPIGLGMVIGGKGGLSWGTYIKTSVNMVPATNDYAKEAFSLPLDIVHCGSDKPFSGDVESELVTRKVNGKVQAERLTYFGYAKVNGRVMLNKKLTVLQPHYETTDVAAKQLVVATAAAQGYIDSLNKQIANASTAAAKKPYETCLATLTKSLKAQSEVNRTGYKLLSKQNASMSLETFEYHTDVNSPGYGTVKSIETVLLDQSGKVVAGSSQTTRMAYSQDTKGASRLVIKTTVSRTGEMDVVSSQTRSRHTGRLLESLDSEGVTTVYSYDPQGNLSSETVSKGGSQRSKTTATMTRKLGWQFDLVEGDITSRMEKDVLGRKVALWLKPKNATSFLQTQSWTYDAQGRTVSSLESDYGVGNKKVSQRQINWIYDPITGRISINNLLKDGDGKTLKTIAQSLVPAARGERFNQGGFSIERKFDATAGTFTESYTNSGSGGCRIERSLSADGLVKSVRYLKVDKSGKETEHDKISFEHDKHGQMTKVKPTLGAASSYTYDSAGRLLTTERNGVTLSNSYSGTSLAPVSMEGKVAQGNASRKLGAQTVDKLGRVASQTLDTTEIKYSYSGGSRVSKLTSPGTAPTTLSGYSSSHDQATRTQTQKVTRDKVDYSSRLVFSSGGRVLSFTDLTGSSTTYEYDFFNRVVSSKNEHCEATCTYADNGLLTEESIKALKAGGLTMKVTYSYDELGQETRRTFTCAGVSTLTLERTLLADGRLSSTSLKSAEGALSADSYGYDESLRLSQWTGAARAGGKFSYDMLGNLTQAGDLFLLYNADNPELIEATGYSLKSMQDYQGKHQCVTKHDKQGRLTEAPDNHWTYHGNGQLATWTTSEGTWTYSYDSEGRVRGGSMNSETDTYHYRGDCIYALMEENTGGQPKAFTTRLLVLRNDSRACLLQDVRVDGKDSSRCFLLRDACGSVVASVDLSNKTISHCTYTPYGAPVKHLNTVSLLGWKGQVHNRHGGYHMGNGYRMYLPKWGRFLTRDSLSPFGAGGPASYAFGLGDPVNYHDPSGHQVVAQYERWGAMPFVQTDAFRIVIGAVGVVIAPFTSGMSALLAVATTALAAVSFSFDMAALILSESDPALSRTLQAWGQAFAIAGAATGVAMMAHGWKGLPRNLFKTRGGGPATTAVPWAKTPKELRLAQQARTRAMDGLIRGAEEAKAAGTFDAFKGSYFLPEATFSSGVSMGGSSATRLQARMGNSTKNLFTGVIGGVDDSMVDWVGLVVSMNMLFQPLISNYLTPPPGATSVISIVGGPFPGRERLFP